jgi:hypothetical protein
MKLLFSLIASLALSSTSLAQTLYVNGGCGDDAWTGLSSTCAAPDGPKRTIQAAIPPTGSTTIIVAPGVYAENVLVDRNSFGQPEWTIVIEAAGGSGVTIDGQAGESAVVAGNYTLGAAGRLILRGLTLQNADTGLGAGPFNMPVDLYNCVITQCDIGMHASSLITATDCLLHDNGTAVELSFGGIYLAPSVSLTRCVVRNNRQHAIVIPERASGGRVTNSLIALNGTAGEPALTVAGGQHLTLLDTTVSFNSGPACVAYSSSPWGPAVLQAFNSILWMNNGGSTQILLQGSGPPPSPNVQYSIVQGGFAGTGNLNSDPLFVNAAAADFHLAAGSPAIDSGYAFLVPGDQNTDLDGLPRFQDDPAVTNTGAPFPTYLDRGAYESAGRPYCGGDTDDDHDVELDDLALLLSQFGSSGTALPGDQNRNGMVDLEDLAVLLSGFGQACP